jgi:hypothetical protein
LTAIDWDAHSYVSACENHVSSKASKSCEKPPMAAQGKSEAEGERGKAGEPKGREKEAAVCRGALFIYFRVRTDP